MRSTRYVKKARGRGWDVIKAGHRRATAHGDTKAEAVRAARELLLLEGGGEMRVLNQTGKILDSTKVPAPKGRAAA